MAASIHPATGNASRRRVLVAYSAYTTHVQTTLDYLNSLGQHLNAEVRYAHVTHGAIMDYDLNAFDAVFHSYCARLPYEGSVSADYLDALAKFNGAKVVAVQDEYERTDALKQAIRRLGFQVVLTCIPPDQRERIYPSAEFPSVEFIQVLTGYAPVDSTSLAAYARPLLERPIAIGYRGRDLGARYGRLGKDKIEIGDRVRAAAEARGVPTDISSAEDDRVYGQDWLRFLGDCRATLGTESGSNVFDFDGSIELRYRDMRQSLGRPPTYEEFSPAIAASESTMDMGQISPRIFETAAVRTPMILMRGRYSDVVQPDVHYIPLERDYSNLDRVLDQLEDLDALAAMATRAHDDLIGSGKYGYDKFAGIVEGALKRLWAQRAPNHVAMAPHGEKLEATGLQERPTKSPLSRAALQAKWLQHETQSYQAEIERLNHTIAELHKAYGADIERLNKAIPDLHHSYAPEIERLNSAIADLHSSYGAEIERLNRAIDELARQRGRGWRQQLRTALTHTPLIGPLALWLYGVFKR